ncbi:Flavin containing monooxygenase FMO [Ceratobasidium theobromae]|uniref:Flavin containing monooxygenase FMO n=1 Tax=Ceratobasidium theobromae TaxID=1582974 RepID=A0A5N5QFJ8_9AGAM|nr:Flavin containing monooxygenase FMO [Ceratobasidium theobromae]
MTILKQSCPHCFAVIGAGGAAGLGTLKVFLEELHDHICAGDCKIVGFEQCEDVGGIWLPEPHPDPSQTNWPSTPLYDSLRMNVPHPIMFFPSHLAPLSTPLFTSVHVVNDYMQSYVNRFGLRKYIRFNSKITAATWDSSINQWRVIYQATTSDGPTTKSVAYFNHLLVANGHYRRPFVLEIKGLQNWASSEARSYIHLIWYRNLKPYRNQNVLIVGGGRSRIDISEEISTIAKKTVHSVRSLGDQDFERIIQ